MSKWLIQSWGGEFLSVEADSVELRESGAIIFFQGEQEKLILSDGSWMTAHDEQVVVRNMSGPRESWVPEPRRLEGARPLAPVVDIDARSKGESGAEAPP